MRISMLHLLVLCSIFNPNIAENVNATIFKPSPALETSAFQPSLFMTNGLLADVGQFAHHAQVRTWPSDQAATDADAKGLADNPPGMCAGSVIAARWILTAASCIVHTVRSEVWLGSVHLARPEEKIRTDQVHVHERYANDNVLYNIALLHLRSAIRFTEHIKPVMLASAETAVNHMHLVSGFGYRRQPLAQLDRLRYARVQRTAPVYCAQYFPGRPAFICTRGRDRPDECPSEWDAGAALVVERPDDLYVQVGVFAVMQTVGCVDGQPVGYVDVAVFRPWIEGIIGPENDGLLDGNGSKV